MSLRAKMLTIMAAAFLAVAAAQYLVAQRFVLGAFEHLEQDEVRIDVDRVRNALKDDLAALSSTAGDWAAWDETRDFVLGKAPAYVERNLTPSALANLRPNFIVFLDKAERPLHSVGMDPAKKEVVPIRPGILQAVLAEKSFLRHSGPGDGKKVLALLGESPALVAAWPVTNNEMKGPIVGTLIVGRLLDTPAVAALAERTQIALRFASVHDEQMPADFADALGELAPGDSSKVRILDRRRIAGYAVLGDIDRRPCLVMRTERPREIYRHGLISARYFMAALFGVGLLLLAGVFTLAQALIAGPLVRLTQHAASIGSTGDLSKRIDLPSKDEIGVLAREFNAMVGKVADARRRLLEESYCSGLAQMASDVLHNVRNSLAPMLGRAELLRQTLRESASGKLPQALEEMGRPETPVERRLALESYVRLSAARMMEALRQAGEDVDVVVADIARVETILEEQEKFSRAERALEPLGVKDALHSAAAALPEDLRRHASVEFDPSLESLPAARAERISLAQVLSILLADAAQAILRRGPGAGRIRVSGAAENRAGKKQLHLRIEHDGAGIDAADLPRLFERGFAPARSKRSGLGLHWCANVITAMNGDLQAESAGDGPGACFHVRIPVA